MGPRGRGKALALAAVLFACASCSGEDRHTTAGVTCGATACAAGQICCAGCGGSRSCSPGPVCAGFACRDDGGTLCGDRTCATGQVCCIDCDGRGSCGPEGTACAGFLCPLDAGPPVACGTLSCLPGEICCGTCESPFCGPPGSDCVSLPTDCDADGGAPRTCTADGGECMPGEVCCPREPLGPFVCGPKSVACVR